MAITMHVKLATFDGVTLGSAISYRASYQGDTVQDSTGTDKAVQGTEVVRKRGIIQVAFRDFDNAKTLQTTKVGTEATLALDTQQFDSATTKSLSIVTAKLFAVHIDAVHNAPGTHIAEFLARSSDGDTVPVS